MKVLLALLGITVLFLSKGCSENRDEDVGNISDTRLLSARHRGYFYHQLKQIGIDYTLPLNFKEVHPDTVFYSTRKGTGAYWAMWGFNYDLASSKQDIRISVKLKNMIGSFDDYKGPEPDKEAFSIVNSNYLKDVFGFTDTVLYKPFWYPEVVVSETWNATAAVLCETDMNQFMTSLFMPVNIIFARYSLCTKIIEVMFLYTTGTTKKVQGLLIKLSNKQRGCLLSNRIVKFEYSIFNVQFTGMNAVRQNLNPVQVIRFPF